MRSKPFGLPKGYGSQVWAHNMAHGPYHPSKSTVAHGAGPFKNEQSWMLCTIVDTDCLVPNSRFGYAPPIHGSQRVESYRSGGPSGSYDPEVGFRVGSMLGLLATTAPDVRPHHPT